MSALVMQSLEEKPKELFGVLLVTSLRLVSTISYISTGCNLLSYVRSEADASSRHTRIPE